MSASDSKEQPQQRQPDAESQTAASVSEPEPTGRTTDSITVPATAAELTRERRAGGVLAWAAAQLGALVSGVAEVLLLGLLRSIWRRELSWRAFFLGSLTMLLGILAAGVVRFVFLDALGLRGQESLVLWGGALGSMALGGLLTGLVGRRVGYWEIYLSVLLVVGVFAGHLAWDWTLLLGIGPGDGSSYFDVIRRSSTPGMRFIGPMWDRIVVLNAIVGFLLALIGGSLAYVFFSRSGQRGVDLEWLVSRRHLTSTRNGFVSVTAVVGVVGIGLGVAALVAVTAVMSGYQKDIRDKILSTNAHLVVQKYGIDFTEYKEVARKGLSVESVQAATPFGFNEAMLSVDGRGMGVLVKGVEPQTAGDVTGVEDNLCANIDKDGTCQRVAADAKRRLPDLLRPSDGVPQLVVGAELFERIGKSVGDIVTVTTPVGIAGAQGNAPKRMHFRIAGAFRSGMHEFDVRLAYTDLQSFQRLMGMGNAVNGVEFRVTAPERVEALESRVMRAIGQYPYRSLDWRELNRGIFTALKLQKIVMFLVLCFIVIVAAFNIASTLFMAVVEKALDIGVLKAMGARDASIMKVFMLEGWMLGGAGTATGLLLGLLVCAALSEMNLGIAADVYMVESLQVRVQPLEVGLTVLAALGISHLATVYPALKAARQRPVDTMRYE